jgi:hypothetical protein
LNWVGVKGTLGCRTAEAQSPRLRLVAIASYIKLFIGRTLAHARSKKLSGERRKPKAAKKKDPRRQPTAIVIVAHSAAQIWGLEAPPGPPPGR